MATWVVFYSDGSSFSDENGAPRDAPRSGVICIAVADKMCGRRIMAEQNYYCWHREGGWVPHDRDGLEQYLDDHTEPGIRLRGYWIDQERYAFIRSHALKRDPRLPWPTARSPRLPESEG